MEARELFPERAQRQLAPTPALQHGDPYEQLPACIRAIYSRQEYLWLTDAEKASLLERELEPDHAAD